MSEICCNKAKAMTKLTIEGSVILTGLSSCLWSAFFTHDQLKHEVFDHMHEKEKDSAADNAISVLEFITEVGVIIPETLLLTQVVGTILSGLGFNVFRTETYASRDGGLRHFLDKIIVTSADYNVAANVVASLAGVASHNAATEALGVDHTALDIMSS